MISMVQFVRTSRNEAEQMYCPASVALKLVSSSSDHASDALPMLVYLEPMKRDLWTLGTRDPVTLQLMVTPVPVFTSVTSDVLMWFSAGQE